MIRTNLNQEIMNFLVVASLAREVVMEAAQEVAKVALEAAMVHLVSICKESCLKDV